MKQEITLATQTKPYCFLTVFQRLISVGLELLISNNQNPTEITLAENLYTTVKNPTFQTENQPF